MSVSGFPLCTRPHHCSHRRHLSPVTWCLRLGPWEMSCLSKVTSSPSTSIQPLHFWKAISFSFFSTYFLRTSSKRLYIFSMALWVTPRMMWIEAKDTRRRSNRSIADWTCRECPSGPRQIWKRGCRYWGQTRCWQLLREHRYLGTPSLQWTFNDERLPLLHLGHTLPDQSGSNLSWIKVLTIWVSEHESNSVMVRFQWACSLRTPCAFTVRAPLTYGTFFQASDLTEAGRLSTLRPLPFLGSGKGLNFFAMTPMQRGQRPARLTRPSLGLKELHATK